MFTQQLEELTERVEKSIALSVADKGVASEFMRKMAIKVDDDDHAFNLDGGRWLAEVTQHELIDNKGYQYQFNVLSVEDLCSLADYLEVI